MDRLSRHGVSAVGPALLLSVCGGEGVRDSGPLDSPDQDGSASEEARRRAYAAHPELRNQYGLEQVKAHHAYARGATGEGVTLGIVDSGVDPSHPKYEGRLETGNVVVRDPDGSCLSSAVHGPFVAGIMTAGRRATSDAGGGSASASHGVAFDAGVDFRLPRCGRNTRGPSRR